MQVQPPELGIIEGYFGPRWAWSARERVVELLAPHGYGLFIYAPKADVHLRRHWTRSHSDAELASLRRFADRCRSHGMRFGIGLSPYETFRCFDISARETLKAKLLALEGEIDIQDLAILFDDMRGDQADLAERQCEIVDFVLAHTKATRLFVCPTYYTPDPILDQKFGRRPAGYLETLGDLLDPAVAIFWTGEEVCAREQSSRHLDRVAEQLRRKPFLWDNYPVNDGPRMSQFLHLRAFTGRPAKIANNIAGHAINPALQPFLGCIPALTLAASYRLGSRYEYGEQFQEAARQIVGEPFATMLAEDLSALADCGLDRLGERRQQLRSRYTNIAHPAAQELRDWLDGLYRCSATEVATQ